MKKKYEAPYLELFGTITDLSAGGSGAAMETDGVGQDAAAQPDRRP